MGSTVDLFRIRLIFDKMGTCIQNNPYLLLGHRKTMPLSPVTGRAVREKGKGLCPVSHAACPRCLGDLLWDSESVYDPEFDVESERIR